MEPRRNAACPWMRRRPATRKDPARTFTEESMTEMTWTAPEACEICVGMEVTSYMSAEI